MTQAMTTALTSPNVIDGIKSSSSIVLSGQTTQYLTAKIGTQMFGLPITDIQDVIEMMPLTHVPLSPPHIAGIMNLRGRIVTAIHLDRLLHLPPAPADSKTQSIVFEYEGELYSLIVHRVGDVMALPTDDLRDPPPTLDDHWLQLTNGIFRLDGALLMILDLRRILQKLKPPSIASDEAAS